MRASSLRARCRPVGNMKSLPANSAVLETGRTGLEYRRWARMVSRFLDDLPPTKDPGTHTRLLARPPEGLWAQLAPPACSSPGESVTKGDACARFPFPSPCAARDTARGVACISASAGVAPAFFAREELGDSGGAASVPGTSAGASSRALDACALSCCDAYWPWGPCNIAASVPGPGLDRFRD